MCSLKTTKQSLPATKISLSFTIYKFYIHDLFELTSSYERTTLDQDINQETSNIMNYIFILYCECNRMMQQSDAFYYQS